MSDVYIRCILFERENELDVVRISSPDPADRVIPRLVHEYRETRGRSLTASDREDFTLSGLMLGWKPDNPDEPLTFHTHIPDSATFADLESLFGDELRNPAGPVWIEHTYSGGDFSDLVVYVQWFGDVLGQLGNGVFVWEMLKGGRQLRRNVLFRREREAIARWRDSGVVDDELRRLVDQNEGTWSPEGFSARFGVTDGERGALLRECGYSREWVEYIDGYLWVRKTHP